MTNLGSGHYEHRPEWYRRFLYAEERARGYDAVEDLASPGTLGFELSPHGSACLIAAAGDVAELPWLRDAQATPLLRAIPRLVSHAACMRSAGRPGSVDSAAGQSATNGRLQRGR